jgi:hypothetical protein
MPAEITGSYCVYDKKQSGSCFFPLADNILLKETPSMNQIEEHEWRKTLPAHDRTLVTAIVSVLLLYLIGLVAIIRSAFRPRENNLKTLPRRLKDSGH